MKNYIKKMVVIFSVAMLVVSMCACGKSEISDTTATTVGKVSTDTDATKADFVSETQTSTTELAEAATEKTTDNVTEGKDTVTEKSTTAGKKSESTTEKKTETTQQATTQPATTQVQTTTQQSKTSNSGNNEYSQNNNQTTTTSHSHTWVSHKKTVHHDAEYEDRTVTKYKDEVYDVIICNTCGKDISDVGSDAHWKSSGTMWVNGGTDENPWWVEVTKCSGSHTEYRHKQVPYTETERVKTKDAYDEEIVDYQYCSGCGQRK